MKNTVQIIIILPSDRDNSKNITYSRKSLRLPPPLYMKVKIGYTIPIFDILEKKSTNKILNQLPTKGRRKQKIE